MPAAVSVSALTQYLKNSFERDPHLQQVLVQGELSNYKTYPSGHHYFTLKDAGASLRCVLFRREAAALRFRPENGLAVLAAGRVTVYPRDGQYQLYCSRLLPEGTGDLALAFQQRRARLEAAGLFDPAHKKPLPPYPRQVALITSPVGAAVRDMLRVLRARFPLCSVVLLPARVQGEEAPGELIAALDAANRLALGDVILLGRGGGSAEDLWAFNDEDLAHAIYRSEIPVISAVGHEPDFTIADFVADCRAATPSNGAELAVPEAAALRRHLLQMQGKMHSLLAGRLAAQAQRLARLKNHPALALPLSQIEQRRQRLDEDYRALSRGMAEQLTRARLRLQARAAQLDALSPLKVLGRGYALAQSDAGALITSVTQLQTGQRFSLRLQDGTLPCTVTGKETSP